MTLKFITTPAYFIGRISVGGVKQPPNNGQLVGATKLELGRKFSDPQKQRAIESLQTVLRRNGFYQSSVRRARSSYPISSRSISTFRSNRATARASNCPPSRGLLSAPRMPLSAPLSGRDFGACVVGNKSRMRASNRDLITSGSIIRKKISYWPK